MTFTKFQCLINMLTNGKDIVNLVTSEWLEIGGIDQLSIDQELGDPFFAAASATSVW